MPILASLNAKNRSKSPFSIGMLFSIISEFTVDPPPDRATTTTGVRRTPAREIKNQSSDSVVWFERKIM